MFLDNAFIFTSCSPSSSLWLDYISGRTDIRLLSLCNEASHSWAEQYSASRPALRSCSSLKTCFLWLLLHVWSFIPTVLTQLSPSSAFLLPLLSQAPSHAFHAQPSIRLPHLFGPPPSFLTSFPLLHPSCFFNSTNHFCCILCFLDHVCAE